jgi:hypothetical protein
MRAPILDPAEKLRTHSVRVGDCLIYTAGSTNERGGHALIKFRRRNMGAHRVAWILANGEIPNGLWVLHSCDVPRCIRVDHLRLGTPADNARDRDERKRANTLHGEAVGGSKLTDDQVREMRSLYANGVSQVDLRRRFGVSRTTVSAIVVGKRWRHLLSEAS